MTPSTRSSSSAPSTDHLGLNLAVITGRLSSDPVTRTLPSGDPLTTYEITVPRADGPDDTVPAVLIGGAGPKGLVAGDAVLVLGRVRRRFFRAGGATASRTEVVADRVVRANRGAAVSSGLRRAMHMIDQRAG